MSRKDKPRPVPITEAQRRVIEKKQLDLDNLIDETKLEQKERLARLRVVQAFRESSVKVDDNQTTVKTPNRIACASDNLDSLAQKLVDEMHPARLGYFVKKQDIPLEYQRLSPSWRGIVIKRAAYLLILGALHEFKSDDRCYIYYQIHEDFGGMWVISQRLADRHDEFMATVRGHRRVNTPCKNDQRHFHGRPRRDRERKAAPPGTSIGRVAS